MTGIRPASRAPIVTAGLTWQPDTGPIRYTSESSVRPNASAVATTPAATLAPSNPKPNISVAAPTARNTRIAVPRNSTANFRIIASPPLQVNCGHTRTVRPQSRGYGQHGRAGRLELSQRFGAAPARPGAAGHRRSGTIDAPRDYLSGWAMVSITAVAARIR